MSKQNQLSLNLVQILSSDCRIQPHCKSKQLSDINAAMFSIEVYHCAFPETISHNYASTRLCSMTQLSTRAPLRNLMARPLNCRRCTVKNLFGASCLFHLLVQKSFLLCSNFFEHVQYFLNIVKFFDHGQRQDFTL